VCRQWKAGLAPGGQAPHWRQPSPVLQVVSARMRSPLPMASLTKPRLGKGAVVEYKPCTIDTWRGEAGAGGAPSLR
jgi:hypothetical protein